MFSNWWPRAGYWRTPISKEPWTCTFCPAIGQSQKFFKMQIEKEAVVQREVEDKHDVEKAKWKALAL
jgi:hypothetical protein